MGDPKLAASSKCQICKITFNTWCEKTFGVEKTFDKIVAGGKTWQISWLQTNIYKLVLLGGYYLKYNFLKEKGSDHNIILNISNKEFFEGHYLKRLDP